MTDTFKGIITADGKKRQLPYGSILDKPVSDETLSIQGGFADAKVTGDNFAKAKVETDSLKGDLANVEVNIENPKIIKPQFVKGMFVNISAVGEKSYPNIINESPDFQYAIVDCDVGDVVYLNCVGGYGPRAYGFLDSDNITILRADEYETVSKTIVVPEGAVKLIINDKSKTESSCVYKYTYVTPELYGALGDGVTDDTDAFEMCLSQKKPIVLSGKHYLITRTLYIKNDCTSIVGHAGAYAYNSPRLILQDCSLDLGKYAPSGVRLKGFGIFSNAIGLKIVSETNRIGNFIAEDIQFVCRTCVHIDIETGYIKFVSCYFSNDGVPSSDLPEIVYLNYTGSGSNKINYVYFINCAFEGGSYNYGRSKSCIRLENVSCVQFINNDICNCGIGVTTAGLNIDISFINNYFWNVYDRIYDARNTVGLLFTGNTVSEVEGNCEPIIFGNNHKKQVVTGNTFSGWSKVTAENLENIFANNAIYNVSDEVVEKLHIGEVKY